MSNTNSKWGRDPGYLHQKHNVGSHCCHDAIYSSSSIDVGSADQVDYTHTHTHTVSCKYAFIEVMARSIDSPVLAMTDTVKFEVMICLIRSLGVVLPIKAR